MDLSILKPVASAQRQRLTSLAAREMSGLWLLIEAGVNPVVVGTKRLPRSSSQVVGDSEDSRRSTRVTDLGLQATDGLILVAAI